MSIDILPDVRCLVLWDGTVYGNIEKSAADRAIEVRMGDALAPFEACTEAQIRQISRPAPVYLNTAALPAQTRSDPAEDVPGDIYACWVNHLEDWTLAGCATVQVMINRFEAPCQIQLGRNIHVANVDEGMVFEACLAAHRAAANLCITFRDPVSLQQEQHVVPFDTAFAGGQAREGYFPIRQPLPTHFQSCDVTLSLDYSAHRPDDKGTEPFLFLADVHVATRQDAEPWMLTPEWLYGQVDMANGAWLRAPLPQTLAPGQNLSLQMGREVFPISAIRDPGLTIKENYGHTLICTAAQDMDLVLSIDGEHVQSLKVTEGDTVIRLPARYLNGAHRLVSIRDKSGSVTLFQRQQLLPYILTPEDVMRREGAAPFPAALLPQTPHRYAALKSAIAARPEAETLPQLLHALKTLEGGPENVCLEPLRFPTVVKPDVSVIIPAHNNLNYTYLTLCSLLLAQSKASFEVILVDDASTDGTARIEDLVKGITVVRHLTAQRFVRACNAGASRARGAYVALLNNDVEVTDGWIDHLLDGLTRFDNVGLVGAKLLNPDGSLQDAGGIVWGSGDPWNYGNGENPNDPRFCYARQADYLSGAALMMPAAVWAEVGGLSAYMEPMYFEDTDLAFKVREAGYATWYIPAAEVYHFEGMTAGTDVTQGFKRHQELNRPKFKRRWASAFQQNGAEGRQPDLEKDRGICGRVLFIDHAPPRPDRDAGSYAALQEMRLVQSLGYKVTFLSLNMAHLGRYTQDLQRQGIEVIHAPFFLNASDYLSRHIADFDAVYITRYYVAETVLEQIRQQAPKAKVLFNNADLHFLRELRSARHCGDSDALERAVQTRRDELRVIRAADVVLSYNDVEHSVIEAYTDGAARVVKCPWVVTVPGAVPAAKNRAGLSFLGSFVHHPNVEGITWFARHIMPRLTPVLPQAHLTIYGAGMGDDLAALASSQITCHGFVPAVRDAYDPHRVFVAPLLSGAGIKGKVLGALAHGIPCVLSPIAAEGIGLRSGHDCFIVESPEEWITAIRQLSGDDGLWEQISQNARRFMHQSYSFGRGRALMRAAFEAAELYSGGAL